MMFYRRLWIIYFILWTFLQANLIWVKSKRRRLLLLSKTKTFWRNLKIYRSNGTVFQKQDTVAASCDRAAEIKEIIRLLKLYGFLSGKKKSVLGLVRSIWISQPVKLEVERVLSGWQRSRWYTKGTDILCTFCKLSNSCLIGFLTYHPSSYN